MSFASRLMNILNERNIKQVELARKANLKESVISEYLHGKCVPKNKNLTKIAMALQMDPIDLLNEPVDPPQAKSPARGQGDITVHGNGNIINGDNNGIIHAGSDEKHGEICDMYQALPEDARKHINWLIQAEYEKNKKG